MSSMALLGKGSLIIKLSPHALKDMSSSLHVIMVVKQCLEQARISQPDQSDIRFLHACILGKFMQLL